MSSLQRLLDNNLLWSRRVIRDDKAFFQRLVKQQVPDYLWIGCSDSRVPANEIVDLPPGELFVHRNVANLVVHTDLNCLSVLQFAVDNLKVKHIIVCGHYGCGGIKAAADRVNPHGLIDNWLRHIQDIEDRHRPSLERHTALLPREIQQAAHEDRLAELNVLEQTLNVCQTTVVQDAWRRSQSLEVHAWVYRLDDGRVDDLGFSVTRPEEAKEQHRLAVERLAGKQPARSAFTP